MQMYSNETSMWRKKKIESEKILSIYFLYILFNTMDYYYSDLKK